MSDNPRKTSAFTIKFDHLEQRRLLTSTPFTIVGIAQQGDFVGSTSAVGPDGIADVHIKIQSLKPQDEITSADIIGTLASGLQLHWREGFNPDGFLNADLVRVTYNPVKSQYFPYFYDYTPTTADLYICPPPTGQTLTNLAITLTYASVDSGSNFDIQTASDSNDPAFATLSATLPASGEVVSPSLLIPAPGGQAHFVEQYATTGTGPTHAAGDVHVSLDSLPSGYNFSSVVAAYLSDGIGSPRSTGNYFSQTQGSETWSWLASTGMFADPIPDDTHDLPLAVLASVSPRVADLTFPPIRNENGAQFTLRYVVKDGSGVQHSYYTQFAGGTTDVTLIGTTYNHNAAVVNVAPAAGDGNVSYKDPTTGNPTIAPLQTLLNDTSGHFDRIYLAAGTYLIDYTSTSTNPALALTRPVQLDGDPKAILMFTADSTAPADTTMLETDYGPAIKIGVSHVTLSNFQIQFTHQVYFASSYSTAVIGVGGDNKLLQLVDVNLNGLTIQGPPTAMHYIHYDTDPPGSQRHAADSTTPETTGRDGRFAQNLFSSYNSSGTIVGNTLRGGTVEFSGGPWAVENNIYLGTVATVDLYPSDYADIPYRNLPIPSSCTAIFASSSPHDQTISGNQGSVTQPAGVAASNPLGFAYRFLLYKTDGSTGYNNLIYKNILGNGVGLRISSDVTANTNTGPIPNAIYTNPYAAPEFVLNENYHVLYEGITLPISADGHILSLPPTSVTFYRFPVQAGDVVAILTGANAGQYFTITQVLDTSDFLLDKPIPAGNYVVAVSRALVNNTYDSNTFDLRNTTSTGFIILGNQFGPRITNNTILGDDSTVIDGNGAYDSNRGIILNAYYQDEYNNANVGYVFPYAIPDDLWTPSVLFNAVVTGNMIEGSLDGIIVVVDGPSNGRPLQGNSSIGRTYLTATITNNHFFNYKNQNYIGGYADPDTSSLLSIQPTNQTTSTQTGVQSQTTRYALIDGNGNPVLNSNPALGYAPASDTSTQSYYFADPHEINVTLSGNWFTPASGGPTSENQTIYSALVNNVPIVYGQSNAVTALPTSPSPPTSPQVDLTAAFNGNGILADGTTTPGSFDASGDAYSAGLLTGTVAWNGQVFNIAPVSSNNTIGLGGVSITLPHGNFTSIQLLGAAFRGPQAGDTFSVVYTDGTYDSFNQTFSDWLGGYTGPGTTAPGESIALPMKYYDSPNGQVMRNAYLYGYSFPVNPAKTVAYLTVPNPGGNIKILAIDEVYQVPQVNLSVAFNSNVILADGTTTPGSFDASGNAYSATALGTTVAWNGQVFNIAPATANNTIGLGGVSITLPHGNFTSIQLLGAAFRGAQAGDTFSVVYTDGTYDSFNQTFSDWLGGYTGPGTMAPGESIARTMNSYDGPNGQVMTKAYLYGYSFAVNPAKTVAYLAVPNPGGNIRILAIDEVYQPPQVNLIAATNSASIPSNLVGISLDAAGVAGNFDGTNDSYSANVLGTTVAWNNQVFNLGGVTGVNVVQALGQTIPLHLGNFNSIQFLGASINGDQSGTILVTYTDTTQDTLVQTFSSWFYGYNGTNTSFGGPTAPGESIAASQGYFYYYNPSTNTYLKQSHYAYVYGYSFAINPTKTVLSITLPTNSSIRFLAIDEVYQTEQVSLNVATNGAIIPFDLSGITLDTNGYQGNFDGTNDSYSANALTTSVAWNNQVFNAGGVTGVNVVQALGQTIPLPSGNFNSIQLLGASVNGVQQGSFLITYTDGSQIPFTQNFSSWFYGTIPGSAGGTTSNGESIAATSTYFNYYNPTTNGYTKQFHNSYVYGYVFPINPAKMVASITLPTNHYINFLAIDEVLSQVNLNVSSNEGGVPFNQDGISTDGSGQVADINGTNNNSYSANALTTTVAWNNQIFNVGGAGGVNVVQAAGQTISLPTGNYSSIQLLGASVNGVQSGTIQVNYTNGTHDTFVQSFSDWFYGTIPGSAGGTTSNGESIAKTMTKFNYYNSSTMLNTQLSHNTYIYGYSFPVNRGKLIASITLPSNSSIKILAIAETP